MVSTQRGILYVVATPIGNLRDLSPRALEVLRSVERVLAEDTRTALRLFKHYNIATPLLAYHDHNEDRMVPKVLDMLGSGEALALIAEAGTPLISDPGFRLVRAVQQRGGTLISIPGPCALIAALAVSGVPTDRFCFEGFLPPRPHARRRRLAALRGERRTMVFYEAPQRVLTCLTEMVEAFGGERSAAASRELTKIHEESYGASLSDLLAWLQRKDAPLKGEWVIVVAGASVSDTRVEDGEGLLSVLLCYLSPSQAAAAASAISGKGRNALYRLALRERLHATARKPRQ